VGRPETDRDAIARALEGDATARRALASKLIDAVHREVAHCLLRRAAIVKRDPRQETADLVQEVLVALFERDGQELRRWDPERGRSLDSFVRLIARRRVARILERRRSNPWSETPIDPAQIELEDDAGELRRLEERGELDAVLVQIHARMSVRDHELFDLLYVEELEPEEVAQRMQMTRQAVNAWSYRMRRMARAVAASVSAEGDSPPMGGLTHGG
jgi:RNA polymerase sigma factor (sigma-70 family)